MIIGNVIMSTLLLGYLSPLVDSAAFRHNCTEPNDLQQRFESLNKGLDLRQLLITNAWSDLQIEFNALSALSRNCEISMTCPNATMKGNYPLMMRSSCPWFFETDHDESRYPKNITFAKTHCNNRCIGGGAGMICERINYQIKVLKRNECEQNTQHIYDYKAEDFLLPIGYTCAQARETISPTPAQSENGLPQPI